MQLMGWEWVCAFQIIYLVVIQRSKETGLESKWVCSKVMSGYGWVEWWDSCERWYPSVGIEAMTFARGKLLSLIECTFNKKTPWLVAHKWTILTEWPLLVGKVSAIFCR
jgi:hypothetical protein